MKAFLHRRKTGSVMIFAVLLMTAGVFVLTAVLQLSATQGLTGEEEWSAVQRRVTLGNSRAMGREYMLSRIFRGSVPADLNATSVSFSNAEGAFTISPAGSGQQDYWDALSTTNTDVVLNINPFNLMERGGFYREVFVGQLSDGVRTAGWSFALRTRSPVAAGYSFAQQRPGDNDLASLASPPYVDMNAGTEQFVGFAGLPRMPLSSVTNVMTRGTGDTNGYQGYLDVPPGASVYGLFTNATFQFRSGSTDELEVRLDLSADDPNVANSVIRYDVPSTELADVDGDGVPETPRPVTMVILEGTQDFRKPLHVVVPEGNTNVTGLTLTNNNSRLVYFYRAKAFNDGVKFDVVSSGSDSWRLGITMSQCDIQFDIGALEVTGGLRTDGEIDFQGGSANFFPEQDPGGLDFIADRMMWLEDYRAQQ